VFLEVRADNSRAQRLYHWWGFTEIGIRRGYYQPSGTDAIVMRRSLASVVRPGRVPAAGRGGGDASGASADAGRAGAGADAGRAGADVRPVASSLAAGEPVADDAVTGEEEAS
jgi:hypothetical protein